MTLSDLYRVLPWKLWGPALRLRWRGGDCGAFRKRNVGESSYVDPTVQIFGWENVTVGKFAAISEGTLLNASARGTAGNDRITIGDYAHIGRRNYFSTGGYIEIKDFGFTGIDCHFLGCGHNVDSPMIPYVASGLSPGAPIELGINSWLTTSVTVLEGVTIGHGSVVGARSVVTGNIAPFSMAVGNPCKVTKRFDFKANRWVGAEDFKDGLSAYMPTESEYRAVLAKNWESVRPALHAASTRFGWLR